VDAFTTACLSREPDATAPDGADVRVLLRLAGGSMAHFELAAGKISRAVTHRTVEEIWFVVGGRGEMWRKQDGREEIVAMEPGVCLTIPRGTHFQYRASADASIAAIAITMPPWPGESEAMLVSGCWEPSVNGAASHANGAGQRVS
jgi:mannose-6-phosphate isomerase-like protein (cupin superfamily)